MITEESHLLSLGAQGSLPVNHRFHRILGSDKIPEIVTISARWVQEGGVGGWCGGGQLVKEMGLLCSELSFLAETDIDRVGLEC